MSLQTDLQNTDAQTLRAHPEILDFSAELHDFSDTAAQCKSMQLVISVDTSIAHLSGALGLMTWVLLPFHPDWRWLTDRNDSPWYPTVRLFRQERTGGWEEVLTRASGELTRCYGDTRSIC